MQSLQCALYCHLHTMLHNRIVVHVLQRYRRITSLFIRRVPHCDEMHCRLHTHTDKDTHTERAVTHFLSIFIFIFILYAERVTSQES